MTGRRDGRSLVVAFDASVRYGPENATPVSGAIGYLVEEGATVHVERSAGVDAVVSSTALEFRALLAALRAVDARFAPSTLHVRGDADAVIRAVDPARPTEPSGRIVRRRVGAIHELVADVPVVSYRAVDRRGNERAHDLARAGHERG